MNNENEMNEEVRQLLDSLEEHGRNTKRQQRLGDLIDSLEASGTSLTSSASSNHDLRGGTTKQSRREDTSQSEASTSDETSSLDRFVPRDDEKRRRLIPLWWVMGAAAACLLLWLLVKPNIKETPETNKEILVEEKETLDAVKTEVYPAVVEEPVLKEELLAEETPVVPQKPRMKKEKPQTESIEEVIEQPILAEMTPTKPEETATIGSTNIPASIEEKLSTLNSQLSTQSSPQRRVIRSLNLVCYECQKEPEPEFTTKPNVDNRTLFGQPQDPNMKNGSLALEFKLN